MTVRVVVGVLGQTSAVADGRSVDLGGPRQRRLLAALAIDAGRPVSGDRLVDRVWGDSELPADPRATLRTYIGRLRGALEVEEVIVTEASGWRLDDSLAEVDAVRFVELVDAADEPGVDVHGRLARLDEALALWRGAAFDDVADQEWARAEADRLAELRVTAAERRFAAMLDAGMHTAALPGITAEVHDHPLRDRLVRLQMLAMFRAGRQAEATRVFQSHRARLADELGLEPAAELVELDRRIVAGDPSLHLPSTPGRALRSYRLGEQLGEGSFAVVYRGTQPSVGRDVAVKIIRSELANRPEFVRRFEAEAHLVARLEHPYIVPLYDYWREPDRACLVFRYLRGGSLESRLTSTGGLSLDDCRTMVDEVGAALTEAHRAGVVHRDVKPANIFLDESGNFYLGDFGIALEAAEVMDPAAALSAGSPAYASPEQLRREPVGPSADVHGLGISIYEALTGRLPFPEARTQADLLERQLHEPIPSVRGRRSDVPPAVDAVLAAATAKDPAERYQSVKELVDAFRAALDGGTAALAGRSGTSTYAASGEARNPYKGLRAFTEADAADFYGRERLVDRLVELMARTGTEGRIAAVVGPSGIGKSSVVRAGLLPALRRGTVVGSDRWYVATMLPGREPFDELAAALMRVATQVPDKLMAQLTEDRRGIARVVKAILPESEPGDVLVVIDQFEELFTLAEDQTETRRFLDALEHALTDGRCPLRVVLTIRADFWDRPLRHGSFARLIDPSTVNVTALAPDELERAIIEPAQRSGAAFEPGLVSAIVADVTDQPGALPLMQYALTELWEQQVSGMLTLRAYRELGGVAGALTRRAEQLYAEATPDEQHPIRRVFEGLVTLGEGVEDTRRRALRSELASTTVARSVIDRFGEARLLSFDRDPNTREPTVEVAHEALIQQWPRLREWLDEDRDDIRIHRHIQAAAAEWDRQRRPESELYRGSRLEAAEHWADKYGDELGETERAFVDASAARRAAEQQAERRTNRRLRRLLTGVAVIAALAVVAGIVAFQQRSRAVDRTADALTARENAEIRRMIAEAADQVETDQQLALLVAAEAYRREPGTATLGALQRVFAGLPEGWLGALPTTQAAYSGVAVTRADGGPVAAAVGDWGVELFDVDSRVRTAGLAMPALSAVALAPGASLVAIADGDSYAVLDTASLETVATAATMASVLRVLYSPDGNWLAIGLADGAVLVSDADGTDSRQLGEVDGPVSSLAWNDDSSLLLVGGGNGVAARAFDRTTGQQVGPDFLATGGITEGSTAVAFAGAEPVVLSGPAVRFDPDTGDETGRVGGIDVRNTGWMAPLGGETFLVHSTSGQSTLVDFADGSATVLLDVGTTAAFDLLDESLAVVWTSDSIALISPNGDSVGARRLPSSGRTVAISDSGRFVVNGFGGPITWWDLATEPPRVLGSVEGTYPRIREETLWIGTVDPQSPGVGRSTFWTLDGGFEAEFVNPGMVSTVGLSPDGSISVFPNFDQPIRIIDRETQNLVAELGDLEAAMPDTITGALRAVGDVEFSPDGRRLFATTYAGWVAVYDTDTWRLEEPVTSREDAFIDIAFTADGSLAATLSTVGELRIRDGSTLETLRGPVPVHDSNKVGGKAVSITSDNRYVMVSGGDGARFWDVETLQPVGSVFHHTAEFQSAELAPEGKLLVTLDSDDVVVWDVDFDAWPEIACRAAGRNMTREEWQTFGPTGAPYEPTCPQWPEATD